jgi:hypothetical protein
MRQHLAFYPPAVQALPTMPTLLRPLIAYPTLFIECCVVEDNNLEEGLMSGDLSLDALTGSIGPTLCHPA